MWACRQSITCQGVRSRESAAWAIGAAGAPTEEVTVRSQWSPTGNPVIGIKIQPHKVHADVAQLVEHHLLLRGSRSESRHPLQSGNHTIPLGVGCEW